jgi:hypothetical protein
MATYNATTGITANDTYTFAAPFSGTNYVLYAAGNFGGGTVTLGYIDSEEDFASFKNASNEDVTLTSSGGAIVTAPPSKLLAVSVTGSTGPVIKLTAILYNR